MGIVVTRIIYENIMAIAKPTLVVFIPLSEIITSLLLGFENLRKKGFVVAAVLMALFTGYVAAIVLHFFPRVPCSCGGIIRMFTWSEHLWFNLLFLVIAVAGLTIQIQKTKNESKTRL